MNLNPFKKKTDYTKSTVAMAAIEKFIKYKAIKVNINTYEAWIMRELHWDQKGSTWRKNFVTNLKTYIDMRRIMNKGEIISDKIKVYDKESGDLLVEQLVKN